MSVLLTSMLSVATVTNGLLAGAFFVFSCAVVPGLRRVDDHTFVRAFQTINRAILNGWFLSIFITAPITGVACAAFSVWWNAPFHPRSSALLQVDRCSPSSSRQQRTCR